jgi:hypothetical protein
MEKYTYSILQDTLNAKVDPSALTQQISASSIIVATERIDTLEDVLDIYFKSSLSSEEVITLTAIVHAHDGVPLPANQFVSVKPANDMMMQGDAVSATIPHGSTGYNIDFKIENHDAEAYTSKWVGGVEYWTTDSASGDWAAFQIIDIDNILGHGPNLILKQYIIKRFLCCGCVHTIKPYAPGEVPIGLYFRVIYHSVGTEKDPTIFINYDVQVKD